MRRKVLAASWTWRACFGSIVAAVLVVSLQTLPVRAANAVFTDATVEAGVSFTQAVLTDTPGHPMHGGGTVGDFDKDGWPDLFVIGSGVVPDKLFINQGDGTFVDQAATWFAPAQNLPLLYRGVGANAGDYNRDGWLDIFVTSMGDVPGSPAPGKHRLYRNNGDGTFTNVAVAAGVNQTALYPDGYGATFGDYDLDGHLDLWVGGWHEDTDGKRRGVRLFHNNGDGTFTDVSVSARVYDERVFGFGAIFADTNDDRYPELLVAADFGTSRYFVNKRDGTFKSQSPLAAGSDAVHNGMGTTVGDFNRDGKLDWFITSIYPAWANAGPPGNRLYMNMGGNKFRMLPEAAGVNNGGWGWGAISLDFDHDGWIDLMHTNGWPDCDPVTGGCFQTDPTYVFKNNGNETFTDVHSAVGIEHTLQGRGMMHFDYDRDGDMDVVILSNQDALRLYRNDLLTSGQPVPADAKWLQVVLDTSADPALAPNGSGTNLTLRAPGAGSQFQRINGGSNYLSGSEQIAHFGVGTVASTTLTVTWPSGFRVVRNSVASNQRLVIAAELPYSHAPLVAGQSVDLVVRGLIPGEVATFKSSTAGTGDGPCDAALGGLCLDILAPITTLGTAVADSGGTATLAYTLPAGQTVYTQATIPRGNNGKASLKTNVLVDTVP